MANVTDPLARAVHGTDPQNLLEYITRQKIYDSRYWKEECFGLNAVNVVEKAASLKTIGGCYGPNRKPTHFLCLLLKLLQIQPDDSIIEEILVVDTDSHVFKYVRALASMYLRLTGRPKDIYELLEPLYNNYSKLRVRTSNDWNLLPMDEFIDCLLTHDNVFGIALPRLAKRTHLEDAGYLEGPRISRVLPNSDLSSAEQCLIDLATIHGIVEAQQALEKRRQEAPDVASVNMEPSAEKTEVEHNISSKRSRSKSPTDKSSPKKNRRVRVSDEILYNDANSKQKDSKKDGGHQNWDRVASGISSSAIIIENKNNVNKKKMFGALFKKDKSKVTEHSKEAVIPVIPADKTNSGRGSDSNLPEEGSEEYWNQQRMKLGMKPLSK